MTMKDKALAAEAEGRTECYVYRSNDKKNWTKRKGPFLPSEAEAYWKQEEIEWNATKDATKAAHPQGIWRSFVTRIVCYEPGQAPQSFVEDMSHELPEI